MFPVTYLSYVPRLKRRNIMRQSKFSQHIQVMNKFDMQSIYWDGRVNHMIKSIIKYYIPIKKIYKWLWILSLRVYMKIQEIEFPNLKSRINSIFFFECNRWGFNINGGTSPKFIGWWIQILRNFILHDYNSSSIC